MPPLWSEGGERMNLYVIGPVTGIDDDNRLEFERVDKKLKEAGHFADIPHRWVFPGSHWDTAMAESIRRMMTMWGNAMQLDEPFGIAMLDGWEQSKGATIEHDLAVALGIPCKPWREWL